MIPGVSPQAESSAVGADIQEAAIALEAARSAPDQGGTLAALQTVLACLQNAQEAYLVGYGANGQANADQVGVTIAVVQATIANVDNWGDLTTFQNTTLYQLHDYLYRLAGQAAYVGVRDSLIAWWGFFGFTLLVLGGVSYRQYQAEKHGRPLNP